MQIRFSHIVLLAFGVLFLLIYFLALQGLASAGNEIYMRYASIILFLSASAFILFRGIKKMQIDVDVFGKKQLLIAVSLPVFLIATIFHEYYVGAYATGIFVGIALVYLLLNRKFYPPVKIFYFMFFYAAMFFVGTIGTPDGFRFPEISLSFYLIPLSFCCFRLSQKTLLRIAHIFFRAMIIYLIICVLYWWFNFQYLDRSFFDWITSKIMFGNLELIGWDTKLLLAKGEYFAAFFFVDRWAGYFHPTFVSMVLLFALITGFYLYHKKDILPTVNRVELLIYMVLCFLVIVLMESRIGFTGFVFVIAATGLYYAKLKKRFFVVVLLCYIIVGVTTVFVLDDPLDKFTDDHIRDTYNTLSINYIKEHFWSGCGFHEQTPALLGQAQAMGIELPNAEPPRHAHNQFIGDMVEYGVWGLFTLLAMLGAFTYYAIKRRSYLLQLCLCISLLLMLIDEPLYIQEGITRFTVFIVFFVAIAESGKISSGKV
ncbi:MAG: O-antigen ligase family protein [Paludibacter sp.]|jgi:hypothetical protein|nr:O-antigen ligase family protein [Paludibacter sp.]